MDEFAVFIPIVGMMIPIVAILATVASKWFKLREKELEQQSTMTAEKAAQYAAHTERLEQRVRVLERIATDRGADVAAEIDALCDERPLN